jgi:hypothetical protein
VVEQVNGTLMLHRRLVREYESRLESRTLWASAADLVRRLTGTSTPSNRQSNTSQHTEQATNAKPADNRQSDAGHCHVAGGDCVAPADGGRGQQSLDGGVFAGLSA